MKALIVGAGAVGAALASRLYDTDRASVALCASGERKSRYASEGVYVNGRRYDFALADADSPGEYDLILLAVKNYNLPEAMHEMHPFVGEKTTIISLLNGITSEEILREKYGVLRVPLAIIIGIDALREKNQIHFSSIGEIKFGEETNDPKKPSDRLSRVSRFLNDHLIPNSIPADMNRQLWFKFMLNVAVNQWTAILGFDYGDLQKNSAIRTLLADTMREVITLSKAMGTGLAESDIASTFVTLDKLRPEGRTSMLQDVDAKRTTEVEAFAGVVMEKCRRLGLAAPINSALYLAIKALESAY
jgi:2-dehydropantoate 2-reductase